MKKSTLAVIEKYDETLERHAGLAVTAVGGIGMVCVSYDAYETGTEELGWEQCPTLSVYRPPDIYAKWQCALPHLGLVIPNGFGMTRQEAVHRALNVLDDLGEAEYLTYQARNQEKYRGIL